MESPMPNSAWIENMPENNAPGLFNMTTSVLDATPVRNRHYLSKYDDIVTLLTGLGLEQCIQNFINAEVDMTVFPTLTEQDLISMGIKTLGARRRIMIAVHAHLNNCMQQEFLMQNQQQQAPSPPTVPMRPQQQQQQQQQTPQQISPPQQQQHQQQSSSPPTPLRGFRFNGSAAPGDERRSSNGT
jgi:SAM domain (Sterile alpha motif)